MKFLLVALLGGIIGGMGMGSGTLLVPLLTIGLGVEQKVAQLLNVLAFIPMAIITIIINAKRHMIEWKYIIYVSISGTIGAICTSFLVDAFDTRALRICFGVFLVVLGASYLISTIVSAVRRKRSATLTMINMKKADKDGD